MRDVVVTRVRHSGPPRRSPNLEERLIVRFPSLYRHQATLLWRLLNPLLTAAGLSSPGVVSAGATFSRDDFELMLVRSQPEVYDRDLAFADLGLAAEGDSP
jgi:hypothetical protein